MCHIFLCLVTNVPAPFYGEIRLLVSTCACGERGSQLKYVQPSGWDKMIYILTHVTQKHLHDMKYRR